ncbi:unnamed protein product [Chondrus crispus]|uniref:Uncharacterized protein n=1 Tax=Chondrus crispus TaxID=2769 RepID=R7QHW3_CHOCR|nr:unnamed protein product [Chondrus crispus]CDF38107.1 unnamed protein product [Chondrus crispus]|eukprot:XP_005717976.1 unnamed protein product [Chondrus crispus]
MKLYRHNQKGYWEKVSRWTILKYENDGKEGDNIVDDV